MHNTTSRLNAIFGFMLSVLSAVTFLCFLSTAFRSYVVPFSVTSSAATVKSLPAYAMGAQGKADLAAFTFDLQADFRSLFDWNTKELFIYLYAEYKTSENTLNQVIIWDKIILRENPQDHVINIKNGRMKYYLLDDGEGLKGHDNVTLILAWNVIPNAGRMPFFTGIGSHHLTIPDKYSTGRVEL
ncbi:signal peptidase complex subunit 3 [Trichuris trichiura]|uniref:Signal peptidase complex subunit 3 n=1 Tax=Trichuris trichiura TaxID=36087 RepID=A0A077Z7U7_TRITR|nr:signal peptidase complex subunit 3 [Trichuris trichiura]